MSEERKYNPTEPILTPEEKDNEDRINQLLSEALKMNIESAGRFKLMVLPNAEHPELSVVTVVFLPRTGGMSQTGLSVNFTDIAAFILDVSKEFMKRKPVVATEVRKDDRMMVA